MEGLNNLISRVVHKACGMPKFDDFWLEMRRVSLRGVGLESFLLAR